MNSGMYVTSKSTTTMKIHGQKGIDTLTAHDAASRLKVFQAWL